MEMDNSMRQILAELYLKDAQLTQALQENQALRRQIAEVAEKAIKPIVLEAEPEPEPEPEPTTPADAAPVATPKSHGHGH